MANANRPNLTWCGHCDTPCTGYVAQALGDPQTRLSLYID
jgi:hypothetical protein